MLVEEAVNCNDALLVDTDLSIAKVSWVQLILTGYGLMV